LCCLQFSNYVIDREEIEQKSVAVLPIEKCDFSKTVSNLISSNEFKLDLNFNAVYPPKYSDIDLYDPTYESISKVIGAQY